MPDTRRFRPTWAEISTSAFASNISQIKKFIGSQTRLLVVLKADGYGHGAATLAPVVQDADASAFIGVSSVEEGIALREAKVKTSILILGSIFPPKNFEPAAKFNLIPTVSSMESARALKKGDQSPAPFHLKVDTGMGRIGVSPAEAEKVLSWIKTEPSLRLAGVYTHLSSADSDPAFTKTQLAQFQTVISTAKKIGFNDTLFHAANSAATLLHKESHFGMVRVGLALYGASLVESKMSDLLKPVLSWHSEVVFLKKVPARTPISYGQTFKTKKESEIATIPIGYADGVPRAVSNKGFVLINEKRCPIVGRVTMDQIMVDVTGHNTDVGDRVTLIGKQGQEKISVEEWAAWADTIPYEILCGISKRVPRVVVS